MVVPYPWRMQMAVAPCELALAERGPSVARDLGSISHENEALACLRADFIFQPADDALLEHAGLVVRFSLQE